ncbi:MAG: methylated-DNA--[protein]-cysteine S-methyltransferase [Tissierellia bacterium]|nr:methylated-DNA--[protein]-cysteine S-methyltransferase [Tissierellia bacterium]
MLKKLYYIQFTTIFEETVLVASKDALVELVFFNNISPKDLSTAIERETTLLTEGKKELLQYFEGKRTVFSLPLYQEGTAFQQKVWNALKKIPYGKTATYSEIAALIGHPKAFRAVGNANNKNKLPIFIPCHRVIGKGGSLTGYRYGLEMKRQLLRLEGANELL